MDALRIHEARSLTTEEWISSKKYAGPSSATAGMTGA
jgi:hypothetical protein